MAGKVQDQLFYLGAVARRSRRNKSVVRIVPKMAWLEALIDAMSESLPQLNAFILPGGSLAAAQLHVARTVCRRAERLAVELGRKEKIGDHIVTYLNRLSDWLFMLARWENQQAGIAERDGRVGILTGRKPKDPRSSKGKAS
jgi:cob(I)alamin adenosyltransferase